MLEASPLDRLVGFFSPRAELLRLQNRAAKNALLAHYEGGSRGRRTDPWLARGTGPTAASAGTLATIRNRSRDLVRNNPWARNAVEDLETETVGTGIVPKIKARTVRAQKTLADLWKSWAETTACDADGHHDLYGLQALAFRTMAESGEVLIRRRIRRLEDGLPIPLQIQVLEPDHLDVSRDVLRGDGSRIVGGVEFDVRGKRAGYWLFPEHPGEAFGVFSAGLSSRFVPADSVLHLYRLERPGQVRGVPWGASAIIRLRDFDEYEDAQLVRQKIAACFSVFIHDADAQTPGAMAGVEEDADPTAPKKPPIERVFPGMIERLDPGKDVTFGTPPGAEGHDVYSRTVLRAIAAGFGTTYEALSGDYSDVNFSSARLGWIRHCRRIDAWRWRLLIPRFCIPVWAWAVGMAEAAGVDVREASVAWSPPRRDMLDPKTEVVSKRAEIRAGLTSLSAAIRERGDDPEEVFAELEEDRDRLDELELIVESDARRPSNGQPGDPTAQVSPEKKAADQAAADAAAAADDQAETAAEETPRKARARRRRS